MRAALAGSIAVAVASGCSPSTPDGGPCGVVGDVSKPPSLEILVMRGDQTVVPLADGDTAPMVFPPQGGRVVFVGVRATNLDGCGVQLTGALRDLTSQQVRVDSRTVNLTSTGDGWASSASEGASSFSNIAVCPNEWSTTDLFGNTYGLEVTVEDREKRTATLKIHVTPQCSEPENLQECRCICKGGYVLGEACNDGGAE